MTNTLAAGQRIANKAMVGHCPTRGNALHLTRRIIEVAQRLWSRKIIADETGVSERAVKYWVAKNTAMTLDKVAALMATDEGLQIVDAMLPEPKPRWLQLALLANEQDRTARQIKATERQLDRIRLQRTKLLDQEL